MVIPKKLKGNQRILLAAEELFASQGFHKTQIADIVGKAEVSNGTFYKYFESKTQLLEQLIRLFADELRQELHAVSEDFERRSPIENFVAIHQSFATYFKLMFGRPQMARILFGLGHGTDPDIEKLAQQISQVFCNDIVHDLQNIEAIDMAVIPDKELVAYAISGVAFQVCSSMIENKDYDVDRAVRTCSLFVAGGMAVYTTSGKWDSVLSALRVLSHD